MLTLKIDAQALDLKIDAPMDNFIVDGQTYTLSIIDGTIGKAYLTMFKGFNYRVHVSSKLVKNYKVSLFDIEKKILFSSASENFVKTCDISFVSNFTGYIQVEIDEKQNDGSPKNFNITIGFKESKATK
jgi:hypothetical protein